MDESKKDTQEIELSLEEGLLVEASLRTLPPVYRNRSMAKLLGSTLKSPELALKFMANPRYYFEQCRFGLPQKLKVDVHQNSENTLHIVLPSAELQPLPKGNFPEKPEITDADLISGDGPSAGSGVHKFEAPFFDDSGDGLDPRVRDDDDPGGWTDGNNDPGVDGTDVTKPTADTGD